MLRGTRSGREVAGSKGQGVRRRGETRGRLPAGSARSQKSLKGRRRRLLLGRASSPGLVGARNSSLVLLGLTSGRVSVGDFYGLLRRPSRLTTKEVRVRPTRRTGRRGQGVKVCSWSRGRGHRPCRKVSPRRDWPPPSGVIYGRIGVGGRPGGREKVLLSRGQGGLVLLLCAFGRTLRSILEKDCREAGKNYCVTERVLNGPVMIGAAIICESGQATSQVRTRLKEGREANVLTRLT